MASRYQILEVIDLQTKGKTYKIYERPAMKRRNALVSHIATREEAEKKVRELEESTRANIQETS